MTTQMYSLTYEDRVRILKAFRMMRDHLNEIAAEEMDLTEWANVEWDEYAELAHRLQIDDLYDEPLGTNLDY